MNNLPDNFPCKTCGHDNHMHCTRDASLEGYGIDGRMCIEYRDYPNYNAHYLHATEEICKCNDFIADNLKYLESLQKE